MRNVIIELEVEIDYQKRPSPKLRLISETFMIKLEIWPALLITKRDGWWRDHWRCSRWSFRWFSDRCVAELKNIALQLSNRKMFLQLGEMSSTVIMRKQNYLDSSGLFRNSPRLTLSFPPVKRQIQVLLMHDFMLGNQEAHENNDWEVRWKFARQNSHGDPLYARKTACHKVTHWSWTFLLPLANK